MMVKQGRGFFGQQDQDLIRAQTGALGGLTELGRIMSAGNGQSRGRESSWGQIMMEVIPTYNIDGDRWCHPLISYELRGLSDSDTGSRVREEIGFRVKGSVQVAGSSHI